MPTPKRSSPVTTTADPTDIDRIFAGASVASAEPERRIVAPQSGRTVALTAEGEGERLTIRAPDGALELSIRLTPDGLVLCLEAAAIQLAAASVVVDCQRFAVHATHSAELVCDGDVRERIEGDRSVVVGGRSRVEAHATEIEARRGNVDVKANDDVVLEGERIYLNR
jgi:hypothetical protein